MIKIPKPSNSRLGENQKECQKICETECQGRQQDHSLRDDCLGRGGSMLARERTEKNRVPFMLDQSNAFGFIGTKVRSPCAIWALYGVIICGLLQPQCTYNPFRGCYKDTNRNLFTNLAEFFEHCGAMHEDYHPHIDGGVSKAFAFARSVAVSWQLKLWGCFASQQTGFASLVSSPLGFSRVQWLILLVDSTLDIPK